MSLSQMWNFEFTSEVSNTRIMRRSAGEGTEPAEIFSSQVMDCVFKISEYITIMQEVKGKDGAEGQKIENREGKCKFWLITYLISSEEET